LEVVTPDDFMGDVMGDINARRGKIEGMEQRGNTQIVRGYVPLAEMFGYATSLRSMTQGRAQHTMSFAYYEQVPRALAEEITSSAGI
jgi:elongation factor G